MSGLTPWTVAELERRLSQSQQNENREEEPASPGDMNFNGDLDDLGCWDIDQFALPQGSSSSSNQEVLQAMNMYVDIPSSRSLELQVPANEALPTQTIGTAVSHAQISLLNTIGSTRGFVAAEIPPLMRADL